MPPFATYSYTNTLPGEWTLVVDASGLNASQTKFWVFGLIDSPRTFDIEMDGYYYQMGESASITATLRNEGSGLVGAVVNAAIARSDSVVDTIALSDQGDGIYAANYTIPDSPGYLDITVVAIGNDNGTDFTRQSNLLAIVTPDDAQFSGTYGDQGNDSNGDGLFEKLDFSAEVNVSTTGDYIISALLVSEDGSLITSIAVETSLSAGTHSVILPFNGDDIRFSETDGPYAVTNLRITEINTGIPSQIIEQAWVTATYQWKDFGSDANKYIYLPLILR